MVAPPAWGADGRPATLNDTELDAFERLGDTIWWRWAQRGRWDPPQSWETEG